MTGGVRKGAAMIQAVVFDMDGLMFDTERLASDAWLKIGKLHGLPITESVMNRMKGLRLEACISIFQEELGEDFDYWALRKERTEYVNRWIQEHGVPVKPGLRELLALLKGHGYKIALATSTYRKTASRYLELAQVSGYFPYQVFGDMVENGKPEPDIFLRAAREVETPPGQCLVLEDSYAGVEAGWRAGCPVIMVPDVLLPTEREKGRTVACVKTLHEVIPWLAEGQKKEREDGFGLQIG